MDNNLYVILGGIIIRNSGRILFVIVLLLVAISTMGCGQEAMDESAEISAEIKLPLINMINGDDLELEHVVEEFKFKTSYSVGDYKFNEWKITDNKTIKMSAILEDLPEGAEVLIDHVHVDMSLKSLSPQLNGLLQDSMDDKYHGFSQDGFYISEEYPYENVFQSMDFLRT